MESFINNCIDTKDPNFSIDKYDNECFSPKSLSNFDETTFHFQDVRVYDALATGAIVGRLLNNLTNKCVDLD